MIYIENKKKKEETLLKKYPKAIIVDVTSKATTSLVKLSPFYPHGGVPIPFSKGFTSMCVEGIWQGLKVFEKADIDPSMFNNDSMKNIKRTVRKFGKPLGHRKGIDGKELLGYIEARLLIYLPSYKWVLEHRVVEIINKLKEAAIEKDIILLDYTTNDDILNTKSPLSHAALVKAYIENAYPDESILEDKIQFINTIPSKTKFQKKSKRKKESKSPSDSQSIQINLF